MDDLDIEQQEISSTDEEEEQENDKKENKQQDNKEHKKQEEKKKEQVVMIEEKIDLGEKEDKKEKEEKKEEKKDDKKEEVINVLAHGLLQNRKIWHEDTDFKDVEHGNREWNCLVYSLEGKWEKVYKSLKYPEREKVQSRSVYSDINNEEEVDQVLKTYEFDHNRWLDVYKTCIQDKNKSRFLRLLVQLETKQNMMDFCYHISFTIGKENIKKEGYIKLPKSELKKINHWHRMFHREACNRRKRFGIKKIGRSFQHQFRSW
eukprot:TRINITY_DN451_c0_g1_i3.p1 TRINITY_DN451_c0_g1~~TRINITY_DN451_c0_g1_i3.p1  ORF type:complete len:261 (-),score=88.64 TRINITY_DN451_c0_g1_i3:753-1535(-)